MFRFCNRCSPIENCISLQALIKDNGLTQLRELIYIYLSIVFNYVSITYALRGLS